MRRKIGIFVIISLIWLVSACQKNTAETKLQNVKPTPTATAAKNSPEKTPQIPENKNYDGKGVVTKINLELVSVELNHENIEGLMPAMIMEFYVTEKSELEILKVGDKVAFVIEYKDGQEKIISIKKIQ